MWAWARTVTALHTYILFYFFMISPQTYSYVFEFSLFCFSSSLLSLLSSRGQTPAQAEINYLNKAKWLEMYGVDMHMVKVTDVFLTYLICIP